MSKKFSTLRLLQAAVLGVNTFYAESEGGEGGGAGAGTTTTNTLPPDVALNPVTNKPWTKAEFTAEVNRQQKEERLRQQEKNKKTVEELEALKSRASTSDEDKATLQKQIDELTASAQTKEEQQKTALSKLQEKYDTDIKKLVGEKDTWRTRFENELFNNEIRISAERHKAVRAGQVAALLSPNKKFTEEAGPDGKPTGRIVPKVTFRKADKDGKEVVLDLTIDEAIKTMTEIPEEYGNLFHNTAKPGFGQNQQQGNGHGTFTTKGIEEMSPEEYEKNRAEILNNATPQGE